MEQSIAPLIQTQRQKQLFITQILIVYLNQSVRQLCKIQKNQAED